MREEVLRPRRGVWLRQVVLPLLVVLGGAGLYAWTGVRTGAGVAYRVLDGAFLLVVLLLWRNAWPLWRTAVRATPRALEHHREGEGVRVPWEEMTAVYESGEGRGEGRLAVLTEEGEKVRIGTDRLDAGRLRQVVRRHAPGGVLGAEGARRTDAYRRWRERAEARLRHMELPCTVSMTLQKVAGSLGLLISLALAAAASWTGEAVPLVAAVVVPVGGVSLWMVLTAGELVGHREGLVHRTPLGSHGIRWDEVDVIEVPGGRPTAVAFRGGDRCLAVPGPALWPGSAGSRMSDYLEEQTRLRDVPVETSFRALFRRTKNAKLPR